MSSERGRLVTGRGKDSMYAGQHDEHLPRYLGGKVAI